MGNEFFQEQRFRRRAGEGWQDSFDALMKAQIERCGPCLAEAYLADVCKSRSVAAEMKPSGHRNGFASRFGQCLARRSASGFLMLRAIGWFLGSYLLTFDLVTWN